MRLPEDFSAAEPATPQWDLNSEVAASTHSSCSLSILIYSCAPVPNNNNTNFCYVAQKDFAAIIQFLLRNDELKVK